jgi:glycosyltransferase involved in cell wall biosynthesis
MSDRPRRIAVVAPILARYDAISTAALDGLRMLSSRPGWEALLLTNWSDPCDGPRQIVRGVADLLKCEAFRSADVLIYHFGAYDPYFDALVVGNGAARQIVRFHNVTPAEFVPASAAAETARARMQIHNLRFADRIWADSPANAAALRDSGIAADAVEVLPLAVTAPPPAAFADKPPLPVEILFVGRIVPSKGVLDLIDAVDAVRRATPTPFRLSIAGNLGFSDPAYVEAVGAAIRRLRLERIVTLLGTVDDDELARRYHRAHVLALPSYHEGFGKTVIEALRAGCVPVTYAAYSLATIAGGLGRIVAPGDVAGFAAALAATIDGVAVALGDGGRRCLPVDRGLLSAREFDAAARQHVAAFTPEALAPRLFAALEDALARPPRAARGAASAA